MDALLLDTDVFSFLMKERDTRRELYESHIIGKTVALSFVTVGELFAWSARRKWSPQNHAELERRIKATVIVPYDLELCRRFGTLKAELMSSGRTIPANDLWIAACALRHDLPLLTHNFGDYEGIPGLQVITRRARS